MSSNLISVLLLTQTLSRLGDPSLLTFTAFSFERLTHSMGVWSIGFNFPANRTTAVPPVVATRLRLHLIPVLPLTKIRTSSSDLTYLIFTDFLFKHYLPYECLND
jgi:hypothetical protein